MELLQRHAADRVGTLLQDFPVVVILGARQVGKSTLAQEIVSRRGGTYVTFDDPDRLSRALEDPIGLLSSGDLIVIDEVQVAPGLLRTVKLIVDRERRPGMFLLTGSANLLRMRSVTESLAGRSAWLELGPLTWSEIAGRPRPTTLDDAFEARNAAEFAETLSAEARSLADQARDRLIRGGMPATLSLGADARAEWYDGYRTTFLERDLRQLSRIERLPDFTRLMNLAFIRSGGLLNRADLASDAGLRRDTATRYLGTLEVGYQLFELPPYFVNIGKRLAKHPKLYANDVGMAAHVLGVRSWEQAVSMGRDGALVETWAVDDLLSIDRLSGAGSRHHFWRTGAGAEVDLVIERGTRLVAIEIKAGATLRWSDTRGLRQLRDDVGDERFAMGILAHMGTTIEVYDDRTCAVPLPILLGVA